MSAAALDQEHLKMIDAISRRIASTPYQSNLSPAESVGFARFAQDNHAPVDLGARSDYDMPGFYLDNSATAAVSPIDNRLHFTDKYKTPNHETISAESKYAPPNSPHWEGNAQRNGKGEIVALELPGLGVVKPNDPIGRRLEKKER